MKESEKLKIEAEQPENDLAALGKYTKVLRAERKERFEEKPYCIKHCAVAYVIPEKEETEKQRISQRI